MALSPRSKELSFRSGIFYLRDKGWLRMNNQVFHPLTLEFHRARLGAMRASIDELIRRRPPSLLTSMEGWRHPQIRARIDRGVKSVPIYQIVGRSARYDDFNQLIARAERCWQPHSGGALAAQTPIELYHVGAAYFVRDGNRRVTEARARGQLFLLAHVTEYIMDAPLNDPADVIAQLLLEEYHQFQASTSLALLRPAQRIECTALGGYADVIRQVEIYRADLETSLNCTIEHDFAVTSWYDTIYMPIALAIGQVGLLDDFCGRGETDLYLWAANWNMHRSSLGRCSERSHDARLASIEHVISDLSVRHH
jgi:hypothetical protein